MLVLSFQVVALGALLLGQGNGIQGADLPGPAPVLLDLLSGDDGIALLARVEEGEVRGNGPFELDATVRLPAGADHHVVHLVLPPPPPALPVSERAHPRLLLSRVAQRESHPPSSWATVAFFLLSN